MISASELLNLSEAHRFVGRTTCASENVNLILRKSEEDNQCFANVLELRPSTSPHHSIRLNSGSICPNSLFRLVSRSNRRRSKSVQMAAVFRRTALLKCLSWSGFLEVLRSTKSAMKPRTWALHTNRSGQRGNAWQCQTAMYA